MSDNQAVQPLPGSLRAAVIHCCRQLQDAGVFLGHGTDNAWDEAVALVLDAAGVADGPGIGDRQLDPGTWDRIGVLLDRRCRERLPLPYLLGKAAYAGLSFRCDPRALVPRSPLAECIGDGYAPWYAGPPPRRILDLCCGGGAIGIAAALGAPRAEVVLADIDAGALALARENIALHGVGERVSVVSSDGFHGLAGELFDVILCNPPYVDAAELARMPPEYHHEPRRGLEAGVDGLALVRRLLPRAAAHLSAHGVLFLEVGNSWRALEAAYPNVPFLWVQLAAGGHGVATLSARELRDRASALGYNGAGSAAAD